MLQVEGLTRSFGGVYAVRDVTITVRAGELRGIIGPNGAGKSTLFNLISGHLAADAGSISYDGHRIDALSAHRRALQGIAVVFQGARVFRGMTVFENVMVGAHAWTRSGFCKAALRLPGLGREERRIRAQAGDALELVGLSAWADRLVDSLPLGQQRALQLARALCSRPKLLLLDEPASGLRSGERAPLGDLLARLKAEGLTMLLVEHDVAFVSRLADRVTVLDLGTVIAEGDPDTVRRDPRVVTAYIGSSALTGTDPVVAGQAGVDEGAGGGPTSARG